MCCGYDAVLDRSLCPFHQLRSEVHGELIESYEMPESVYPPDSTSPALYSVLVSQMVLGFHCEDKTFQNIFMHKIQLLLLIKGCL